MLLVAAQRQPLRARVIGRAFAIADVLSRSLGSHCELATPRAVDVSCEKSPQRGTEGMAPRLGERRHRNTAFGRALRIDVSTQRVPGSGTTADGESRCAPDGETVLPPSSPTWGRARLVIPSTESMSMVFTSPATAGGQAQKNKRTTAVPISSLKSAPSVLHSSIYLFSSASSGLRGASAVSRSSSFSLRPEVLG